MPPAPIYDSKFLPYRVSPLHLPAGTPPLHHVPSLQAQAGRLADIFRGDVVGGVYVGSGQQASSDDSNRARALISCEWKWLGRTAEEEREDWESVGKAAEEREQAEEEQPDSAGVDGFGLSEGILVKVEYEGKTHLALLIREKIGIQDNDADLGVAGSSEQKQQRQGQNYREEHLPLLLVNMPGPLREQLIEHLTTTFDTRIEPMRLPDRFLGHTLEMHLAGCVSTGDEIKDAAHLEAIIGDLQITQGFKNARPFLHSMDTVVSNPVVQSFVLSGRRLSACPAGEISEDHLQHRGQHSTNEDYLKPRRRYDGPFMTTFVKWFREKVALNLQDAEVSLTSIGCKAYTLGKEGKVKIVSPAKVLSTSRDSDSPQDDEARLVAVKQGITVLIHGLIRQAQGSEKPPQPVINKDDLFVIESIE